MSASVDRDWFPPAIARFVECVEAGKILKSTEFAGAVSVTDSNRLRNAGSCRYDSGAIVADGEKVALLFHCHSELAEQGIGALLDWDGERVTRVGLVSAEIRPERTH